LRKRLLLQNGSNLTLLFFNNLITKTSWKKY
jgi:hypothetical protein